MDLFKFNPPNSCKTNAEKCLYGTRCFLQCTDQTSYWGNFEACNIKDIRGTVLQYVVSEILGDRARNGFSCLDFSSLGSYQADGFDQDVLCMLYDVNEWHY